MKGKTGMRAFSVLLTIMLVSVVVPVVSAEAQTDWTIDDLRGKDISMGEFYASVEPVKFSELPVEMQNEYYNMKMIWLDPPEIGDKVQVIQQDASELETKLASLRTRDLVILMRHVSDIDASGRDIDYRSESWVVFPPYLPMAYGEITSALCKLDPDGQTGTVIDYVTESDEQIDNLKAEGSKSVTESGDYFTDGYHLFYAPAGYIFSPSMSHSQTDVIHVS